MIGRKRRVKIAKILAGTLLLAFSVFCAVVINSAVTWIG